MGLQQKHFVWQNIGGCYTCGLLLVEDWKLVWWQLGTEKYNRDDVGGKKRGGRLDVWEISRVWKVLDALGSLLFFFLLGCMFFIAL